jgi:kinesin family protein 5
LEELEKTAEDRAKKLEIYEKDREREKQRQKQREEAARLEAGLESLADELSGVELEVESMDGATPTLGQPRLAHSPPLAEGEPVESFEMEMLRAEKEQYQAEAEQLRKEKDELEMRAEQMQREYEHKALALDKEREEEKLTHNEEKRKQLEQELNDLRQKTAQKLAEFDHLKTSLLRDLQNRCEKVIDLEMLLDEAREQYEQLLKNSSNKSLQKRNMFLERNLEQLTRVHQQLVNQNNELRLEKKVSEKKLAARNERIRGLEVLLSSAQEKLQQQSENHGTQVSKYKQLVDELKAKLDQAQARAQSRGRSSSIGNGNSGGARIIKPIRGGGGRKKPDLTSSSSSLSTTASPGTSLRRSSSALSPDAPASNGKRSSSSNKEKATALASLASSDNFALHSNTADAAPPSLSPSSSAAAATGSPYRPPRQSSE